MQGGIQAEAFDGKSTVGRDEFFPGKGFGSLKKVFKKVAAKKPAASRDTSAEVYLVSRDLKAPKNPQ